MTLNLIVNSGDGVTPFGKPTVRAGSTSANGPIRRPRARRQTCKEGSVDSCEGRATCWPAHEMSAESVHRMEAGWKANVVTERNSCPGFSPAERRQQERPRIATPHASGNSGPFSAGPGPRRLSRLSHPCGKVHSFQAIPRCGLRQGGIDRTARHQVVSTDRSHGDSRATSRDWLTHMRCSRQTAACDQCEKPACGPFSALKSIQYPARKRAAASRLIRGRC